MDLQKLHQLTHEKKFSELEKSLKAILDSEMALENSSEFVLVYKNIYEEKQEYLANTFYLFWKYFNTVGKVKLAVECAEEYFSKLFKMKKIIKMQHFISELQVRHSNSSKKRIQNYQNIVDALKGNKDAFKKLSEEFTFSDWHIDYWEGGKETLKEIILNESGWTLEKVKHLYEYVLKFYFEEEVFLNFKDNILLNNKFKKDYLELMTFKKVSLVQKKTNIDQTNEKLNVDYDKIALELISGERDAFEIEQNKIISFLKHQEREELKEKGYEMLIAFRLLDMNEVVIYLGRELGGILSSASDLARVGFVVAQSLIESNRLYESKEYIENILATIPLVASEQVEFLKLKKEIYLREKNASAVKEIILKINHIKKTMDYLKSRYE